MEKRLRQSIDYLIDSREVFNDADLANQLDMHRSYLSRVLHGNKTVTPKFVEKLTKRFPQINGNWILTGEGDMVISGDVNIENRVNSHNVEVRASGNSNVSINNRGSAETQSLRAKLEILERQNAELQRLLDEEKERSKKYWQMIEKLTNN